MVGYRYSGGHFKETGKGAPGRLFSITGWAGPRGGGNPLPGERQ
jgi:hypothetical protein